MTQANYRVKLQIGDWSRDGHNIWEDHYVLANMTGKEIEKAYKLGTKKLGFDFSNTVAAEFEDGGISTEKFEKLKSFGYVVRDGNGNPCELETAYGDEESYSLDPELFADIYMFIAKLGNPDLEYSFESKDYNNVLHIGGYGLFQP